jgi:hypothetical protein
MDKTKMDDSHPKLKYFSTNVVLPHVFFANMHVFALLNFMLSLITTKKKKKQNHCAYEKHPMDINPHQISAPK